MPRPQRSPLVRLFGHNLRAARHRAALSQEALAEEAGLHPTYIGLVERGQRNISLVSVERLAKALAVVPWELLHPGNEGRHRSEGERSERTGHRR